MRCARSRAGRCAQTLRAPRVLAPNDVRNIEERTAKAIGESVDLTVRARTDVLVTGKQYQAVGDVRLPEEGDGVPTPEARSQ